MTSGGNSRRDAHRTIAGYVYQTDVTVHNWLRLRVNEHLELEAGEDIDVVRDSVGVDAAQQERLLQQLKNLSRPLTLRSPDTRESLAHFCHHRKLHPENALKFRFLTTATVGREQAPWSDVQCAIDLWEDLRTDQVSLELRAERQVSVRWQQRCGS